MQRNLGVDDVVCVDLPGDVRIHREIGLVEALRKRRSQSGIPRPRKASRHETPILQAIAERNGVHATHTTTPSEKITADSLSESNSGESGYPGFITKTADATKID